MAVQSFREIVGAAPSRVSAKESALIVIDAQNEYANGKLKVANVDASRKVIANLLEHYRKSGGKIIHVVHQTPDGAPVFTPQTDLAKEFAELEPKDGEKVIQKHFPSSFADTELDQYLKSVDLKQIVLTGYMAHVCVSTTARDGARYGYDVVVVEDGIGDRDIPGASGEDVTKMTILELGDAFATIIPSKDVQ